MASKCIIETERTEGIELKTTSGYNFVGYRISEDLGVISESVVIDTTAMEDAKKEAMEKLIQVSYSKGGNAIIGVNFEYITIEVSKIAVSVYGIAVIIEKED